MNKNIGIIIVIIIVGIGVFVLTNKDTGKDSKLQATIVNIETQNATGSPETRAIGAPSSASLELAGSFEKYSPEKLAFAESGYVVLHFSAPWCPSCRVIEADINKNLDSIPTGVVILKTDYDSETELKKKYSVTTQHTFVQVDAQGNMLKKWHGGSKLNDLLSQIQ